MLTHSRCAHKFIVQKVDGGAGKMVEDNHAHCTMHTAQYPPNTKKLK